jgi:hypothetical protein
LQGFGVETLEEAEALLVAKEAEIQQEVEALLTELA